MFELVAVANKPPPTVRAVREVGEAVKATAPRRANLEMIMVMKIRNSVFIRYRIE